MHWRHKAEKSINPSLIRLWFLYMFAEVSQSHTWSGAPVKWNCHKQRHRMPLPDWLPVSQSFQKPEWLAHHHQHTNNKLCISCLRAAICFSTSLSTPPIKGHTCHRLENNRRHKQQQQQQLIDWKSSLCRSDIAITSDFNAETLRPFDSEEKEDN